METRGKAELRGRSLTETPQDAPADVVGRALAGHLELERVGSGWRPWRLPVRHRRYAPPFLLLMAEFAAGVRLRLQTDADTLHLDLDLLRLVQRGQPGPASPSVLAAEVDGRIVAIASVDETGLAHERDDGSLSRGEDVSAELDLVLGATDTQRLVVVWLPHDSAVVVRRVTASRSGRSAAVTAAPPHDRPRWVHHGSSISHGGSVFSPADSWPVRVARTLDLDLVNLGFGGNAMLDPMTATAIRDTPADLVSLELGINVVAGDTMRERVFAPAVHGFLDRIREGHPDTPVLVVTPIVCPELEAAPGPIRRAPGGGIARAQSDPAGRLTLEDTRRVLRDVVEVRRRDGEALTLVEGELLLGAGDVERLPDGLHPDDVGHKLIAERLVTVGLPCPRRQR